jgi:hypothetical protein
MMKNIQAKHIKKYESLCRQMQKLLDEMAIDCPEVNIYVEDSGHWNLMSGADHDDGHYCRARQDRVIVCCDVMPSSGGGW